MAKVPAHKSHLALAQEFYSRYQDRIAHGVATYGEFIPSKDKRCMSREAQEEILDGCGSYMEFLEAKRPDLTSYIQKIRAKGILIYGELKKLEELELQPEGKERTR
jgi:hypothetical protein